MVQFFDDADFDFATRIALGSEYRGCADAGTHVSARTAWLRASLYFDHASAMSPGSSDPDAYDALWERQRQCWDAAVPLFDPPIEKVAIPFEGGTLEG